ncbi:MAG: phosphoadenosine phosphosulfate reductase family protein [Desulfovibrionaceae bacterium]
MRNVFSFSGGKDSTAMVVDAFERGEDIADVVFFDTGWEFPAMAAHIAQVEEYIGRNITRLVPPQPFSHWMFDAVVRFRNGEQKGQQRRTGNGWPSPFRRWCTRIKVRCINHYQKGLMQRADIAHNMAVCIGYAADETERTERTEHQANAEAHGWTVRYPLIERGMTEPQALAFCKERGFDWGGCVRSFRPGFVLLLPAARAQGTALASRSLSRPVAHHAGLGKAHGPDAAYPVQGRGQRARS